MIAERNASLIVRNVCGAVQCSAMHRFSPPLLLFSLLLLLRVNCDVSCVRCAAFCVGPLRRRSVADAVAAADAGAAVFS